MDDNKDQEVQLIIQKPEQSTKQKIATKILYVSLCIAGFGIGLFLYWANQNSDVIKVNNEPFPVRTIREHPTASGVVILKVDYCKIYESEGDLRISFLNSNHEIFLPIAKERSSKGCHNAEFPIVIPDVIQPGKYKVKFRVTYSINPIKRNIVNEFESKEFEVVK